MRSALKILSVVCLLCFCTHIIAQSRVFKVAVFAPVYIDSAFNGDEYKLGRNNIPRYILPGLDFYNGVMMAVDSLNAEKVNVQVLFYDTHSENSPVELVLEDTAMKDVSMIIASFGNRNEIKTLADFAAEKKIPLISSTYPSDGGITQNPYFILLNPRLIAHIEAIYKFLHRTYPVENITMFRRKGNIEDVIQSVLLNMNKTSPGVPLKINTVELADSFAVNEVTDHLDSSKRQNIVICGTLDENFGLNLSKAMGSSKAYHVVAVGMPTWDALKDISKDIEVIYTTPYNVTRTDKTSISIIDKYRQKYAGRPSDMVFKGFESMYHFTKLLLKYPGNIMDHLSDKEYKLFNDFDIQPVMLNRSNSQPDYRENKKMYFVRKADGKIKSVN